MPHSLKGQRASRYRPSTTRKSPRLSPIPEGRARELWNKVRRSLKNISKVQYKFVAKKGRFSVFSQ